MKPNHPQFPHPTGWRRHFTGQRLRIFIILSIAAHLILGLSWGVPAYVKQRREDEQKRLAAQLLADQKAAAEKAEAEAKAKATADTLADVKKQTRKAVDSMVANLPQKKKDQVWDEIAEKLDPTLKQMADALADRATTESDLRNLQSELNREMITAVNEAINGNAQEDEAASFMAIVQDKLLPELIRYYGQNMQSKVSQPLHGDVEKFINEFTASTKKTFDDVKAAREEAGKQLAKFRDELDNALKSTDAAQDALARNADGKRAGEIKKLIDAAGVNVTNATAAGESLDKAITAIATGVGQTQGTDQFADRLMAVKEKLADAVKGIALAKEALARSNAADASKALTALSLDARKIGSSWATATDEASRVGERGMTTLRLTIGAESRSTLPDDVQSTFGTAYKDKASERITAVLTAAFVKRLEARGIKNDELVTKVTADVKTLFEKRMADEPLIVAAAIKPLLNYGKANAEKAVSEPALAKQFGERSHPIVVRGIDEIVANAEIDKRLAELANERPEDLAADAAADRIANAAANQSSGRTAGGGYNAIGTSALTDLRSNAIQRTDDASTNQPMPMDGASTQPLADPLVEDVKRDLTEALKRDINGLMDNKLAKEQSDKVVDAAATAGDADVTRLAEDVLNKGVSDSELEARRTEFSLKMMGHIKDALDDTAAKDVEAELFKQLTGATGTQLGENIRKAVTEQVGSQLATGFADAAKNERGATDKGMRELRTAIDAMRDTAAKAGEILEGSRVRAQRGVNESAASSKKAPTPPDTAAIVKGERERLAVVSETLGEVRKDLAEATKGVEIKTDPLKEGLTEIDKAFDGVNKSLAAADAAAEKGDPKAFADAVAEAKKALDPYRKSIADAAGDLQGETAQTSARFLKAAKASTADQGEEQGIATKVTNAFDEEFRKTTAPKLAGQIVEAYKQKLARGGVDASAGEAELRAKIEAELTKQVGGGEPVGKTAVADVERRGTFKEADKAVGEPDAAQVDKAKAIADAAVKAGISTALGGERGRGEIAKAMTGVKGPSDAIIELKDKFGRMEGQLRAGRGGLMADEAGEAVAEGEQPGSVAGVRKKWQTLLAAASAQHGEGEGQGQGAGAGQGAGQGSGQSAAIHGPGQGEGPGFGDPTMFGGNRNFYGFRWDDEKYQKLLAALKDRDNKLATGAALTRVGATGNASELEEDQGYVRPAKVVIPTTLPTQKAENDQPYTPTFKSLGFIAVPYLTQPMKIDGNFDDWKDVPAVYLKPERWDGKNLEGLQIAEQVPVKFAWDKHGLYFMLDMDDPDRSMKAASRQSFWHGDTLEIFMDTMNTKEHVRARGAGQQFWVWPAGSAEDATLPGGESYVEQFAPHRYVPFQSKQMPLAVEKTAKGYRLECRINTEFVRDADLIPGKILGLNFTVETGTRVHYYWSASKAAGTYNRPDTWGDVLLGGSDGKLEIPEQLADETGGKGDPTKTTSSIVVGQPLRLRVSDGDMNLNDRLEDKVMVTVANPANGDSQVAILKETGADTGIFEGAIRTALDIGEKVPGVVSVFDGQKLRVTYVDQARANGARDAKVALDVKAASPVINGIASR